MATPATKPRPAPARRSAAEFLRAAIEKAEQEGVARSDMTLVLTNRDATELKRDPNLPLADISFEAGVMSYLGVKVKAGGVETSTLERAPA
jgi:hypothetical protein